MDERPAFVDLDSAQLRALAHPLRLRLLGALRLEGASTATALAERLDSNSGKTSYHLRVLAEVGLVVEDAGRGNARDRWWRAAHDSSRWSPGDFVDDPDDRAAADWLLGQVARHHGERVEQWLASRDDWSPAWVVAADISDLRVRLCPERLRELNDELLRVVRRYLDEPDSTADRDAVDCTILLTGFPDPDPML